jgi:formate hydrogenlyase transcriptional activator
MASASETDETLRSIIDAIPGHVFILDRDAGYVVSNQQALDYLGLTHEQLAGQDVPLQVVHPDDIDRFIALRKQSFAAGTLFETEARVRGKDGQYRWFLVRIKPLRDANGQIIRWYGIRTEIDARKRAEETVRENERELRTTIETIPAYVWTNLPDGTIDFVSQTWLDYIGLTRDQYLGWRWTENVHPDDVDAVVANYREALATGSWPKDQEVRSRNGKGEYRWFLCRARPHRGESGEIVKWYGTIVDIEDRKRAEEALRAREVLLVRTTDELQKLKDQLEKENLALKDEINEASMFEEIVGSSDALRRVLSMVSKVAPTESTVLITGETGTGKELVARAIHKRSDRAARAFVAVSCAAIAPSLVTSELFGYEKGAFTGALQRHLGRFEVAEGGTIFLDEVGELPPETQIALLRVLQERTFERVGGVQSIPANVRVVAATNRDLEKAIEAGAFRQDLYYRLNVFPLHMPPLRNRALDIPMLVQYFTQRYAARIGKKIVKVDKTTLTLLQEYRWPGNVRELQNVIERAVILCDGDTLVVDETWLQQPAAKESVLARGIGRLSASEEKAMIESALAGARGRVAGPKGAAAYLGIARSTLESRIRALRINKNTFKSQ